MARNFDRVSTKTFDQKIMESLPLSKGFGIGNISVVLIVMPNVRTQLSLK